MHLPRPVVTTDSRKVFEAGSRRPRPAFTKLATLSCLVLALVLLAVLAQPARASFPVDQLVATDPTNSLRPQIAADSANNLHLVWYDAGDSDRAVKYVKGTVSGAGYSWSSPVNVYAPGGAPSIIHPRVAVDRSDRVHVVWGWDFVVYYTSWPASQGPAQSSGLVELGAGALPAVTTDANNHVHVAWESDVGGFDVLYRESIGGEFGETQNISGNGADSLSPELAVDAAGILHLVWYDKSSGVSEIYYTRRAAGGWLAAQSISGPDSVFPSISADAVGCVYISWNQVSSETVEVRSVCNEQLGGARAVGTNQTPRRPAVGSTANGTALVAWDSPAAGRANIFYSTWNGTDWSAEQRLAASDETQLWVDVSGMPNGRLAVTWQQTSGGQFDPVVALVGQAGSPAPTPSPAPNAPPTGSFDFANQDFRSLWTRTDSLVQQNRVDYSWIWGPAPFTAAVSEYYLQSPGQIRQVQYFDKSRMEINQPDAARGPFYVSNGRLADELITGQLQIGDAQYEPRQPADIVVAGDPQNTFPTYRQLQSVYRRERGGTHANEYLAPAPDGSVQIVSLPSANNDPSMEIVQRVAGLGIPRVFWQFLTRSGPVLENGAVANASPLFDWRYVVGEPITEGYWTTVKIQGQDRSVFVQAFERRVLTFTPDNAPQFQVEMGNIGRHYFTWRYGVRP